MTEQQQNGGMTLIDTHGEAGVRQIQVEGASTARPAFRMNTLR